MLYQGYLVPLHLPTNHSEELVKCVTITYPYFGWLDDSRSQLEKDEWVRQKKEELRAATHANTVTSHLSKYHIDNGFLKYKARIVIGP